MDWQDMPIVIGVGLFLISEGASAYRVFVVGRKPDTAYDLYQALSALGCVFFIVGVLARDLPSCVAVETSGWLILGVSLAALFVFVLFCGASLGRIQLRRDQRRETTRAASTPT